MLKKYFISNIVVMVLLNVLVKPFYIFAIDRNVQNVVGTTEFGLYASLINLTIIFNILLDLGITNFNNKSLAENPKRIVEYLPSMLIAKSILSVLFIGIVFLVAALWNYDAKSLGLLSLIVLIQLLSSFLLFLRSNVSAHHDFRIDSFLSVADKFIMIGVCSVLLFVPTYRENFRIEWFIYAQLFSYSISILIALGVVIFKYATPKFSTVKFHLIKNIIKQSMPYALLILLMGIYMRADSVLLERLLGDKEGDYENGLYVSAFRILDALNMIGVLFAGMLLPMFSRMLSKNNKVSGLVQTTMNILMPVSLVVLANALFFNAEIMDYLYVKNTEIGSNIYRFVMMSFPAYCLMYVYSTLLTAKGSLKMLIRIALAACIISITANSILIPHFKALAVSWVAVGVHWFAALCYIIYCIRETDVSYKWSWLGQFVFFFIAFCFINYMFKVVDIPMLLSILLNVIIFIPMVFALKLWKWRDITKYFQEILVKNRQ